MFVERTLFRISIKFKQLCVRERKRDENEDENEDEKLTSTKMKGERKC